jgi:N-acyl-D-amino-acid deacylase
VVCPEVVGAEGLVLAPGFVDIHAHTDIAHLATPGGTTGPGHGHTLKLLQGVTTEVFSNCGIGFAPVSDEGMALMRGAFGGLFSFCDGVEWEWRTTAQYLSGLAACGLSTNAAYLAPHGAIRASVMGMVGRPATPDELGAMRRMLRAALDDGALGLSTGPGYSPMGHALPDELIALAADAGFCAIHQRDYRGELINCTRGTVEMARASGARWQLSHLQTSGPSAAGKAQDAVALLADARRSGVDIACDMYPYTAGSTVLPAILPDWVTDGGAEATLARLADPAAASRIEADLGALDRYWPSMVLSAVASHHNARFVGWPFPRIAQARSETIGAMVRRLLIEEDLQVCYVVHHMRDDDLDVILSWEHTSIGSDGLHLSGSAHPRVAGAFARWLGPCVRDRGIVDLPEAIRRATSASADRLNLRDRGRVVPGHAADLVLFDPKVVADHATYEEPYLPPAGIAAVWVNGTLAVRNGSATGARAGQVLGR